MHLSMHESRFSLNTTPAGLMVNHGLLPAVQERTRYPASSSEGRGEGNLECPQPSVLVEAGTRRISLPHQLGDLSTFPGPSQ